MMEIDILNLINWHDMITVLLTWTIFLGDIFGSHKKFA